jgi:hypothetical protein
MADLIKLQPRRDGGEGGGEEEEKEHLSLVVIFFDAFCDKSFSTKSIMPIVSSCSRVALRSGAAVAAVRALHLPQQLYERVVRDLALAVAAQVYKGGN